MNFPVVYAVKHKDFETRMSSRSGGIFTALSDYVLGRNGVIYGCVLDEKFQAYHMRAESAEDRNRMRGSKYIQSSMHDCFRDAKADLINGKMVMFTGTSCQIAGLRSFLGKPYENLIAVDIVCHGVPSPLVWKRYLEWQEKKNNGKVIEVDFRNKKDFGWNAHIETLYLEKDSKSIAVNSTVFKELFFSEMILRPSCYKCPYKDIMHTADITIADYWGINKAAPGFNDDKGVSLVLINNAFGKSIFEKITESTESRKCRIEDSIQLALRSPSPCPDNRDEFWNDYNQKDFSFIVKKYGTPPVKIRIKNTLRNLKRKFLKKNK